MSGPNDALRLRMQLTRKLGAERTPTQAVAASAAVPPPAPILSAAPIASGDAAGAGAAEALPLFDLSSVQQLDVATLRKLAENPDKAKRIADAQKKIYDYMDRLAELLAADLSGFQDKDKSAVPDGPISMAQLSLISRQGQWQGKNRLELAKDLLVASVINYGNRNWDPADPSTSWTPERNPSTMLSLLLLGPVDVPA